MEIKDVTVLIKSRGRKYFQASYPGKDWQFDLVINEISRDFQIGQQVTVRCQIDFTSSSYSTKTKITPLTEDQAEQMRTAAIVGTIERWLSYVEEKSPSGYLYQKGVDTLTALGINDFPEFASRLDAAVKQAQTVRRDDELRRWLEYVEEKAGEGRIYERGIRELTALGIDRQPELVQRLETALTTAREIANQRTAEAAAATASVPSTSTTPAKLAEAQIWVERGEGYSGGAYSVGQMLRHKVSGLEGWYVVIKATSRYYSEDGMSFGVGDEQGYVYSSRLRPATVEESVQFEAEVAEVARLKTDRAEKIARVSEIHQQVKSDGERPERVNWPVGETLFTSRRDYFHLTPEGTVWALVHNGADGDDWSYNNLPGAIGWFLYDPDLALELRDLAAALTA